MGILSRILARPAVDDERHWTPGSYSYDNASGEDVSPSAAMFVSAWFACIRNISMDIAMLPKRVIDKSANTRRRAIEHPAHRLLNKMPNPEMTPIKFCATLMQHAVGFEKGVAEIVRDRNYQPTALWPLDPTTVIKKRINGSMVHEVTVNGIKRFIPDENMIEVLGLGWDATSGYSMAALAREALGVAMASQRFAGSFFKNGTWLGAVLEHPAHLSDQALQHLREGFSLRHGGAAQSWKPYIAEEGMTYKQLGIAPEQGQMLETRKFQVSDLARYYRMMPHKIQDLGEASYNNMEEENHQYVPETLMPWGTFFEQECERKLFNDIERETYEVRVDYRALLRGNMDRRAAFYKDLFGVGMMTINMMLDLEDYDGIGPAGDVHYVPLNMVPAEVAAKALSQDPNAVKEIEFRRKAIELMLQNGITNDVIVNMTNLRELVDATGLPRQDGYEEPWLPVTADAGPLVTGAEKLGPDGEVIGGEREETAGPSAAPDDNEPIDDNESTPNGNANAGTSNLRPIAEDVFARIGSREVKAVGRVIEKQAGNAEAWCGWWRRFAGEHETFIRQAVAPLVMSSGAYHRMGWDVDLTVTEIAESWMALSERDALTAFESGDLEQLQRTMDARSAEFVGQFCLQGVDL